MKLILMECKRDKYALDAYKKQFQACNESSVESPWKSGFAIVLYVSSAFALGLYSGSRR